MTQNWFIKLEAEKLYVSLIKAHASLLQIYKLTYTVSRHAKNIPWTPLKRLDIT